MNKNDCKEEIGKRITFRRMALGWSQADLCRKSGVGSVQLSRYERHEARPSPIILARIAHALFVSFTWLAYGRDESESENILPNRIKLSTDVSTYILSQASAANIDPRELASRLIKIGIAIYELEIKNENSEESDY